MKKFFFILIIYLILINFFLLIKEKKRRSTFSCLFSNFELEKSFNSLHGRSKLENKQEKVDKNEVNYQYKKKLNLS